MTIKNISFLFLLLIKVYLVNAYDNKFFHTNFNDHNFNDYVIRKLKVEDKENLKLLYQRVAAIPGGLARTFDEITDDYIKKILFNGINNGLALVAEHQKKLIGSIIIYRLEPQVFSHLLSEGTILVDPDFQRKGIGSNLISLFLKEIEENQPEILRVEIIARESNPAINLYEKLGFKREGRFEGRIKGIDGTLEADIPMAWLNPNFKAYE